MTLAIVVMFLKLSRVTIHFNPAHWLMLLNVTVQGGMDWARSYCLGIALSVGLAVAFLNLHPIETVRFAVTGISSRSVRAALVGLALGLGAWLAACWVALALGQAVEMEDPTIRSILARGVPRAWV